jgi:hypothetical protein
VVLYILDTPRCTSPQSFMSNMLQAVSILYKTKLPMILVRGLKNVCEECNLLCGHMLCWGGTHSIAATSSPYCTAQDCLRESLLSTLV